MAGRYTQFSPSTGGSPQLGIRPSSVVAEHDKYKYLSELLAERQNLGPFMQVLPNCSRLLSQEIVRVTALVGNSSFLDQDGVDHGSPLSLGTRINNGGSGDLNGWGDRLGLSQSGWHGTPATPAGPIVKRTQRIDVPVDKFPNVCIEFHVLNSL